MEDLVTTESRALPRPRRQDGPTARLGERLRADWDAAGEAFPCLVVGMGRWGKVLAGVIADARGDGRGLAVVARSNTDEIAGWAKGRMPGGTVFASIEAAAGFLEETARRGFAIVASDPARHLVDWSALHTAGAPVLVEKPLAAALDEVETLAEAAMSGPLTGLGIEFSLLPIWPYLRSRLSEAPAALSIRWEDPANEMRFGALKRRHPGVSLVADVSCHLASVLNHFCDVDALRVTRVDAASPGAVLLSLTGPNGPSVELRLTDAGTRRRRELDLEVAGETWSVDFAAPRPVFTRNAVPLTLPETLQGFDSSLRLEVGAFLRRVRSPANVTPLVDWLAPCARFHRLLAEATTAGAGARA